MNTLLPRVRRARTLAGLFAGLAVATAFAQSPAPSVATGEDWTFPFTVTPHPRSGFFRDDNQFQATDQQPMEPYVHNLQFNAVDTHWGLLNPSEGVYDFSFIKQALEDAYDTTTGKPKYLVSFRLECATYSGWDNRHVPDWVLTKYGIGSGSPTHTFQTRAATSTEPAIIYAAPWHNLGTGGGIIAELNRFIRAFTDTSNPDAKANGIPFIAHPSLMAVLAHGVSGSRGEEMTCTGSGWTGTAGFDKAYDSAVACGFKDDSGGTSNHGEVIGNAVKSFLKDRIDFWVAALNDRGLGQYIYKICNLGGGRWANTSYDAAAGVDYDNYARGKGMGTRQGGEQWYSAHWLPPKWSQSYLPYDSASGYVTTDWTAAIRDGRPALGENEANRYYDPHHEGDPDYNLAQNLNPNGIGIPGKMRDLAYRSAFFRTAQLGQNFLWVGPWQLRYASRNDPNETDSATNVPSITTLTNDFLNSPAAMPKWWLAVANKGPATSPDAACWLRQSPVGNVGGIPTPPNPADWKNMERMLMQRDITGAITTPNEQQDMPQVDTRPDTVLQEYMARRTDYATGNRKIAFKLDPIFKASLNPGQDVQIKVTYRDNWPTTTNGWKVTVVKSGDTTVDVGSVSMAGGNAWKTATFTVQAANLFIANPTALGTDAEGKGIDFVIHVPTANQNLTVRYVRVLRTAEVPQSTGLIGHWKLDETSGTTAVDSSGQGQNGTLTNFPGTPTWTTGQIDGGLSFDGANDLVSVASSATLSQLPAMTLAAWVKPSAYGSTSMRIVGKGTGSNPSAGFRLQLVVGTNQIEAAVDHATTDLRRVSATNQTVTNGQWTHVAMTWSGGSTLASSMKLYLNGHEVTGYATSDNASGSRGDDSGTVVTLGNSSSADRAFNGVIDDVRIYDEALDDTAVLALASSTPNITTTTLPSGRTSVSYGSQQLNATGGTSPYTWSVSAGSLPAGLSLSSSGVISGTPTSAGTANFTAHVVDSASQTDDQPLSITIATNSVPSISTTTLPGGTVGAAYSQTVNSSGGDIALTWSVLSGSLPAGLTLSNINSQNATISGTPSAAGTANFTLQLADIDSDTDSQALSIAIAGVPEANVQGNSVSIVDGDSTPTTTDHTDFGSTDVSGGTVTRTYTIQNTGSASLTVGSVSVSGTHAADFTVTAQPASSVAAGSSTTFSVQFDPSASGTRSAALSFSTNDSDENPYNFSIQGTGTVPAIAFRAAANANSGSSSATSLVINKPAGVVSGDFMLAGISFQVATTTVTPPSGWTLVRHIGDGFGMDIYKKVAGGSEPSSYTWTFSSSDKLAGGIVAFSGVNATTPIQIEDGAAHSGAASTTHTTPTISTTGSTTWLVSVFGDRNSTGSTWSPPSGTTERVDTHSTSTAATSLAIYTQGPVSAGSKSHTATASVSEDHAAMEIIALQP